MAIILSQEQCNRIRAIREEIRAIHGIDGWMCEGADDRCNAFFNNDIDGYFLADYSGNIVFSNNVRITQELRKLARLEGQIQLVVERAEAEEILEEEPRSHSATENERMTLKELLNFYDFDYTTYPDGYGLVDLQHANLGDIEAERFEDPTDMVRRIFEGPYGDDYLLSEETIEQDLSEDFDYEHKDCVEEYIRLHGDDKDFENGYLYYSLHPEELGELPPILKEEELALE